MTCHPANFNFSSYRLALDGHHDYYGITLKNAMGGFPAGAEFEAGSEGPDGAIHVRSGGDVYYLGHALGAQKTRGFADASIATPARYQGFVQKIADLYNKVTHPKGKSY